MDYKSDIKQLVTYKDITRSFCKKHSISPYQLLLLVLSNGSEDINSVESKLMMSGYVTNRNLKWFTSGGQDKIYNLDATAFTFRNQLQRKSMLKLVGTNTGPQSATNIELLKFGKDIIVEWQIFVTDFLNTIEKKTEDRKALGREFKELIDMKQFTDKNSFTFKLDNLPTKIKDLFYSDGEEAYLKLCETLLTNVEDIETDKNLKSLPIFLDIPTQPMVEYSKDYYRGGLTLIRGWITGFSKIKNIDMGAMYRCTENKDHIVITGENIELCNYCGHGIEKIVRVDMPVIEVNIETKNMDRIDAYVHADLWKPEQSISTEHKILLFRMKEKGKFKQAQNIKYIIIGVEKEEEKSLDTDKAEQIAELKTSEILDLIDNSLFSDLAGSKLMKQTAILSLASINTQNMKVRIKNGWKNERGIINTIFWGAEGTAKTQICQRLVELVSHHLSKGQAGNTSIRGLTAAYDAENKHVRAGLIPINDTRAVLIDELDKFKDFSSILQPLEEKKLDYSKAGINVTYKCDTVMFMTGNNNKNPIESDALEQMKKELEQRGTSRNPIIDRCDLIFVVHTQVSGADVLTEWLSESNTTLKSKEDIKNYFETLRLIEEVEVESDSLKHLLSKINELNINFTPRRLNSLLRLASAISKLHLRSSINNIDIDEALDYYTQTLETMGITVHDIVKIDAPSKFEEKRQKILDEINKVPMTTDDMKDLFGEEYIDDIIQLLKLERLVYADPEGQWRLLR